MPLRPRLDAASEVPLYRQLSAHVEQLIAAGELRPGDRLPPTRELAGQLGLNRTTVSAAYELLESEGLIRGSVGRGSFVCGSTKPNGHALDWQHLLTTSLSAAASPSPAGVVNFTNSRPSEKLFPVDEFRTCCQEVLKRRDLAQLLQLGSPRGYEPLRTWLLARAHEEGIAHERDDLLITNGCQQAVDLLSRALIRPGTRAAIEEPVYPGLRNLFLEAGASLNGIAITGDGIDLTALRRALEQGAKVVVLTPSFQNPTGRSIPANARRTIVDLCATAGAALIENDIYSALDYAGAALPRLKSLDRNVILMGSFSKIAFPGMRVGWILAPRPVIARVTELKQLADLHTDQLSQAVLLHFAESGRLAKHGQKMIAAGRENLRALEQACRSHLSDCRYTVPAGGMNVWIELPDGLDASTLRGVAQQAGVDFLPGRWFSVSKPLDNGLRLSFGGLEPEEIRRGISILGKLIRHAVSARDEATRPALAMV